MIRTYSELITFDSFEDRYKYLKLDGRVGDDTFGYDRYLNQQFYRSTEWKHLRDQIIVRDMGCDLGHMDYEIFGPIYIHHMNPLTKDDILQHSDNLLNPEYLICVSYDTHQRIHYGDPNDTPYPKLTIRRPNDTCPWK